MYGFFLIVAVLALFLTPAASAEDIPQPKEYPLESGYSKPEKAAAVFADMSSYYRLCTSRPERIIPVYGGGGSHPASRISFQHKSHSVNLIILGSRLRHESAPFSIAASCEYYVFALRRLLC